MRLEGRTAVVTGAQQGIGAAVARVLAREGAAVVVGFLDREDLAGAVVAEIAAAGGRAVAARGDVAVPGEAAALVAAADPLGGVDVLVNNAGIFPRVPLLELTPAQWDEVLDVNLKGTFLCTQAAARHMREHGRGGVIVNVASVVAYAGSREGGAHYVASKAGVVGFTRAAALELAPLGIRVNALAPGLTDTAQPRYGMTEDEIAEAGRRLPLGHIAAPEDVADCALFLACDESRHVTGQTLHVNGGQIMP